MTNRIYPTECVHVREGELDAAEEVVLTTVGERDADFRYMKGPDRIRLCLLCAGMLMACLTDARIVGDAYPEVRE